MSVVSIHNGRGDVPVPPSVNCLAFDSLVYKAACHLLVVLMLRCDSSSNVHLPCIFVGAIQDCPVVKACFISTNTTPQFTDSRWDTTLFGTLTQRTTEKVLVNAVCAQTREV